MRKLKKCRCKLPLNLQLFAEPAPSNGSGTGQQGNPQTTPPQPTQQAGQPEIDYARIQQMLDGTLAAKEDTALKAYFKQQGLSQQEAEQAMAAFKQQKAANQPDIHAMQTQITQSQEAFQKAKIENAAILEAVALGVDAKTIPYLIKMADTSQVMGQDGKINQETLKNALNKVLEDVPGLKPSSTGSTGFVQVGTQAGETQQTTTDDQLAAAFGNTK